MGRSVKKRSGSQWTEAVKHSTRSKPTLSTGGIGPEKHMDQVQFCNGYPQAEKLRAEKTPGAQMSEKPLHWPR